MPELPMMPFWVQEWLLDTEDLSAAGYKAYHRLLCHMWLRRDCALPDDPATLAKRAGINPQKWRFVWAEIEHYFEIENGLVTHQKLSKVRTKARSSYQARARAGSKGAAAKWRKNKETGDSNANGKRYDKQDGNQNQTFINKGGNEFDLEERKRQSLVSNIKSGKPFLCTNISAAAARALMDAGLVTQAECEDVGIMI